MVGFFEVDQLVEHHVFGEAGGQGHHAPVEVEAPVLATAAPAVAEVLHLDARGLDTHLRGQALHAAGQPGPTTADEPSPE